MNKAQEVEKGLDLGFIFHAAQLVRYSQVRIYPRIQILPDAVRPILTFLQDVLDGFGSYGLPNYLVHNFSNVTLFQTIFLTISCRPEQYGIAGVHDVGDLLEHMAKTLIDMIDGREVDDLSLQALYDFFHSIYSAFQPNLHSQYVRN